MSDKTFKKTPLASGIALAIGTMAGVPSVAQQEAESAAEDDATGAIEEVVVVGIRGSLTSSMNLKRDAQGIVDGILAEDIGKFPDSNLAESLQRISGVSIDRSAIGEGQRVTVRGVGPDFNLVTLNGRQMPASRIEDTTASNSRAFDFANLASEAIAAVEIHKTSRASIPTGGIGATVNIKTARPLAAQRTLANFGSKLVLDQSTDDGDAATPEISGIFSTASEAGETGRIGVAVTGSYQDRNLGYNQAAVPNGWRAFRGDEANWGTIPFAGAPGSENITNRPGPNDVYSVPQNLLYSFNEIQRERINGQLVFQYQPADVVTATLDYTYSENTLETQRNELSAWFNFGPSVTSWTDGPTAAPTLYSETIDPPISDLAMGAAQFATKNENNSLGLNVEWFVGDNLLLKFDYHDSDATSGADSPYGSNAVIGTAEWHRGTTAVDFTGEFPVLSVQLPTGQTNIDPAAMVLTGRSFRNSHMKSEVGQLRLSGELDLGENYSLDFGAMSTDVTNRSAFSNVQTDSWGGFGIPEDYPDAAWGEPQEVRSKFDDLPGSDNPALFNQYFEWDFEAIRAAGIAVAGSDASFRATDDFTTDRITEEESLAFYVQYNHAFFIGDMSGDAHVGLRWEKTDVVSSALVPTATGILWVAANEFSVQFAERDFTTLDGDYDYLLPSFDVNLEVREGMVVRASYSQTIGRPGWGDIQGGQTINQLIRIDGGTGQQGDPGLLPLESGNFDISFEWYYGDSSYASISYFAKDIDNYVGITTIQATPFDLPHPAQGRRYNEALAAVGSDLNDIRNYIFANYGNTPEVTQTGEDSNGNAVGTIAGIAGQDPAAEFDIVVPANQRSAEVDGWELAVQHMFWDSGFGISLNFTDVSSNLAYNNADIGDQFAIEGLSDSANIVAFYEQGQWSARIAYNWRDDFLAGRFDGSGLPNPVYTEAYAQWDMNVSFHVTDKFTVFGEGINVTDEHQRLHGRHPNQALYVTQTGPRFTIGLRYDLK